MILSYLNVRAGWDTKSIAQSAEAVEYTDCTFAEGPDPTPTSVLIWHLTIWWWGSSNNGALGNTEYPFVAIAPRSTLAQRGSTW